MTAGLMAMLIGLFGVPVVILWLGHRLRRRSPRRRAVFWGMLVGYGVAACAALVVSMAPAEMWADNDTLRGLLGLWSMLTLPALGAVIASIRPGH